MQSNLKLNNELDLLFSKTIKKQIKSISKHDSETSPLPPFFLLILLQYTNIHTQNVLRKTLMSRKHSYILVLQFCLLNVLHCVLYCHNLLNIYIFSLKTEATGSSCCRVTQTHLVHGITPTFHRFASAAVTARSRMKGRRQKSQCEAEALDISARCGPRGEEQERDCIAWVGFELSVW